MQWVVNGNSKAIKRGGSCDLGAPHSAKRRFIAAVMTIHTADDMLQSGDTAGAIQSYRQAIEICPPCDERGSFQVMLGTLLFDSGDAAAAEMAFCAAVTDGCAYPFEAHRRLSFALAAQGRYAAARDAIDAAGVNGEDMAFVEQYRLILALAQDGLTAALQSAQKARDLSRTSAAYRCRFALLQAELQRLDGNRAAAMASLDLAAATVAEEGLTVELALWLAALDQYFGRLEPRVDVDVAAAFAAEPEEWPSLVWRQLEGEMAVALPIAAAFARMSITRRAENQAIIDRFQGLRHEARGEIGAAKAAYQRALVEPHVRWCAEWHIAKLDTTRLTRLPK